MRVGSLGSRAAPYVPGELITRYEVLHGHVWLHSPATVVADDGHELAVVTESGAPFTFPDHPHGRHPWADHEAWSGPPLLQVMRAGERYAVWFFLDPTPGGWAPRFTYVNFESPVVRFADGFGTDDHGLDLLLHPDGRREWKDVEDLHHQRAEGRISTETVTAVLESAAALTADLDADRRWWALWESWRPGAPWPADGAPRD